MRTRYALVGVGSRGMNMFARPIIDELSDVAELVGLCDANRLRLQLAQEQLGGEIPLFTDFAEMLQETDPHTVIVCTVDATHHIYIIAALQAECDVISEKPLTTDPDKLAAILEAERQSTGSIQVSFNARYGAAEQTVYSLLQQGIIGKVLAADYVEFLNTRHGADYFRRWHRQKDNSGGLLVHKATHHFDQLNWWLGADPESVYAIGRTAFYGPTRDQRGIRCLDCPYSAECEFALDLEADEQLKALYLDAESADRYYRDRCVFSPEIDIEDSLALVIRYQNGVLVNYSLNAYLPLEGQRIGFSGAEGRIEVDLVNRYHGPDKAGDISDYAFGPSPVIHVYPRLGRPYDVPVTQRQEGGHGGADTRIRAHLFRPETPDPLRQRAGFRAGAMSALIGFAGNRSIASGQPVRIADLITL